MNPALDLLYRLVALAVCVYCARKAWLGYVERRILFVSGDWLDWSRWSRQVFDRDTMPIRYLDADGRHGLRRAAMRRRCDHRGAAERLKRALVSRDAGCTDDETVLKQS